MLRGVRSVAIAGALALALVATASAAWGGKDPVRGFPVGTLPSSCDTAPTAKECIDAGVWYLDRAREKVGLPAYKLPADFPDLTPAQQMFILVNLDRVQYGLPTIPGLTTALNHDALASGVWRADDPRPSNTNGLTAWWPGWAGAFSNVPIAYEVVVWNDGLGSTNPRCTSTDHSRCWGHRHSVLWKYGATAAMGAAAGRDSSHHRGYAYLFVGGSAGYTPAYSYTWKQAVADGAGTNAYAPGIAPSRMCQVPNVVGLRLVGAKRAIEKTHCAVGTLIRKHTDYVAGLVINQRPFTGRWTYPPGRPVTLILSLGPRR